MGREPEVGSLGLDGLHHMQSKAAGLGWATEQEEVLAGWTKAVPQGQQSGIMSQQIKESVVKVSREGALSKLQGGQCQGAEGRADTCQGWWEDGWLDG